MDWSVSIAMSHIMVVSPMVMTSNCQQFQVVTISFIVIIIIIDLIIIDYYYWFAIDINVY